MPFRFRVRPKVHRSSCERTIVFREKFVLVVF